MKYLSDFFSFPYSISNRESSFFRLTYGLYVILFIGLPFNLEFASYPSIFFFPPPFSLANITDTFLNESLWTGLHVIIYFPFWFMILGFKTKVSTIIYVSSMVVFKSYVYSIGKVDHDFQLIILPLFMLFTGWGDFFSIDSMLRKVKRPRQPSSVPLSAFAIALSISYLIAGFYKIKGNWLDISTQAIAHIIAHDQRAIQELPKIISSQVLFEAADWLIVLFEVAFVFCYPKPNLFRPLLLIAILFHTSVLLLMGIHFRGLPLAYLPFFIALLKEKQHLLNGHSFKILLSVLMVISIAQITLFFSGDGTIFKGGLMKNIVSSRKLVSMLAFASIFFFGCYTIFRETGILGNHQSKNQ